MGGRIKCFLVERTGRTKWRPYAHEGFKPCGCGDPECNGFTDPIWRRLDTGEELFQDDFPPGAMWFAPWYEDHYKGTDGRCLVVRTPAGDWIVDSVASNCTRKDDKVHKCWVREGEAPDVTVGEGGNTCAAGAGSILQTKAGGHKADYHGFLRNGYLEEC